MYIDSSFVILYTLFPTCQMRVSGFYQRCCPPPPASACTRVGLRLCFNCELQISVGSAGPHSTSTVSSKLQWALPNLKLWELDLTVGTARIYVRTCLNICQCLEMRWSGSLEVFFFASLDEAARFHCYPLCGIWAELTGCRLKIAWRIIPLGQFHFWVVVVRSRNSKK